jgi:DNA polymerase-1
MATESQASRAYARREHYVSAAMGRITLEGFRVDVDLTMSRWSAGQARLEASKRMMHEKYGMPLEGAKPHTTNPGKAAFRAALLATGIPDAWLARNWKLNADGSLATAKDVLTEKAELFEANPKGADAAEICRTILAMNGERTVYGTVLNHLVGNRVHPYIGPDQSSGRWSMKNPGLTVLGKRGGKARERAMMLADEGEVLVAIDADQIDARMIAVMSQDPEYMKLFAPGVDLHSEVAFRVWPNMAVHGPDCHQLDEFHEHECGIKNKCHCDYRDKAKVFGHGWNYGMGPKSMAANHGVDVTVAEQFDRGMQEAFPVLCGWKEETRLAAGVLSWGEEAPSDDAYRILHTVFGRPVRVERNRAYTQACAQLGQGSTRDGMAEAILKLPADIRRRIRAVIHDEIVISLPAENAQERAQAIADGMAFDLRGVRISFGCSRVAKTWAGAYGEQYEAAA